LKRVFGTPILNCIDSGATTTEVAMGTTVVERDNYESWTVDLPGATVFMEVYNPPQNGFAAKHLLRGAESSVAGTLASRNLSNVADAKDLGDKMLAFNLQLKATKELPTKKTASNTMIDCSRINVKTVAAKFAQAIIDQIGVAGANQWYDDIKVDLSTPCVCTEGKITGTSTMFKFGGTKVGTSNKGGKTFISFKVDHGGTG
jgi:hypothetical protein